jgi:uncharacterized protein YdbL (DUF1318 family)
VKRMVILLCLLLLGSNTASALSLHEAKAAGLVGERNDGYLGYVVTPPGEEVQALVKEVNDKRRAIFTQTARDNGLQTGQVAQRFYQRAVKETAAGDYYQDPAGNWTKK